MLMISGPAVVDHWNPDWPILGLDSHADEIGKLFHRSGKKGQKKCHVETFQVGTRYRLVRVR